MSWTVFQPVKMSVYFENDTCLWGFHMVKHNLLFIIFSRSAFWYLVLSICCHVIISSHAVLISSGSKGSQCSVCFWFLVSLGRVVVSMLVLWFHKCVGYIVTMLYRKVIDTQSTNTYHSMTLDRCELNLNLSKKSYKQWNCVVSWHWKHFVLCHLSGNTIERVYFEKDTCLSSFHKAKNLNKPKNELGV